MTKSDIKIKLFADGADIEAMKKISKEKFISGLTTNPSLMKKAGVTDYKKFALEVLKEITELPLSFEVFSDDFETMEKEAREIGNWAKNVYIKIPITNTKGDSSIPLIKKLSAEGLKVNVTAILTLEQVEKVINALTPGVGAYISVFAGRIADTGVDPMPLMKKTADLCNTLEGCESLWASTREVYNIIQAEQCGCHIITVTNDILNKLPMMGKDLAQLSLETVNMFYNDAKELSYKLV